MADILYLVDRLEDLLSNGFRVPFTTNAVIDEEAFLDLIDQMRIAIPNEIRQAQRVIQEKDRVLAQAREEADRILAQAHEEANRIISDQELVKATHARAESLMITAQDEAEEVRAGADDYALGVLEDLSNELERIRRTVNNGLESLQVRRAARQPAAMDEEESDEEGEAEAMMSLPEER
jgi:DNA-directed RNA polymerase beta' subunit